MVLNVVSEGKNKDETPILSNAPVTNSIKRKAFEWVVIDSAIIGGIAAFSAWTGDLTVIEMITFLKAFVLAFLIQMGVERGIKRK